EEYQRGVGDIRRRIARGDVYQVNLCRVLTAELAGEHDAALGSGAFSSADSPSAEGSASDFRGEGSVPGSQGEAASPGPSDGRDSPGSPDGAARRFDPVALAHLLAAGNPARYQGVLATGD